MKLAMFLLGAFVGWILAIMFCASIEMISVPHFHCSRVEIEGRVHYFQNDQSGCGAYSLYESGQWEALLHGQEPVYFATEQAARKYVERWCRP